MTDLGRVEQLRARTRKRHPKALTILSRLAASVELDWPDDVWLPMAATAGYLTSQGLAPWDMAVELAEVHAVLAWSLDRAVITIEPQLLDQAAGRIAESTGGDAHRWAEVPTALADVALPAWCPYVVMPDLPADGQRPLHGVFVHREYDVNTGRSELRLVMHYRDGLDPLALYLDRATLGAAAGDYEAVAGASSDGAPGTDLRSITRGLGANLVGIVAYRVLPLLIALGAPDTVLTPDDEQAPRQLQPAEPVEGIWRAARTGRAWTLRRSGILRAIPN